MERGPGAVTLVCPSPCARLAPRREQRGALEKVVRGCHCGGSEWQVSPGLAKWKVSAAAHPGSPALTPADPPGGCRCTSGWAPFSALCAGRLACALPTGGAALARRARPSLRQWVWTRVGEEGEGRLRLLPLPPPLFSPSEREVPSFCGLSRLYSTMPSRVAGLQRTRREAAISNEIFAFCCCGIEHWGFHLGSSWGLAALFVGLM